MFLLLLLLFPRAAHADAPTLTTFTRRDGLAGDFVTCLAFAPDGSAWVGTTHGATRIEPTRWTTFTQAHGLGNSWVTSIAVAPDGRVWVGTRGGGLSVFDGKKFVTYSLDNSDIPNNFVTAVAVDAQNRVWVGTFGDGVARFDPRAKAWTKYRLANNFITALALDVAGLPWVGTEGGGAFHFDGARWRNFSTRNSNLASDYVHAVVVAPDARVYFGTDAGVSIFDGADGSASLTTRFVNTRGEKVTAIALDPTGRAWLATAHELKVQTLNPALAGRGKGYELRILNFEFIQTLAFDAQGNLWIGTPRGLIVRGNAPTPPSAPLPVVLVHGWHGPESDDIDDSEFRFLKEYMEADGFRVFYAQGIDPRQTLFQNAARLRDDLAAVKKETGAAQVNLIGFSMGGLNVRSYLESSFYQNDVRRVAILGTPEQGVRVWYPILLQEIARLPDEPSAIELSPEYAAWFNATHQPRATVPYDLLTGDAREQECNSCSNGGLAFLADFPANDALIGAWSALALDGPNVRKFLDDDLHAWFPAPVPFDLKSYLYPATTYERYLRNALRAPDAPPLGSEIQSAPLPELPRPAPRNHTSIVSDKIRAGETLTRTIDVDVNPRARFILRSLGGEFDLSLRAPDGTKIVSDTQGVKSIKADLASVTALQVEHAQAGTWKLIATRTDKGTAPVTVETYADLDAPARLNIATDQAWYNLNAPVVITATLTTRPRNVEMRARILPRLGKGVDSAPTEMPLFDDGAHHDSAAGDGVYGNVFSDTTRGGWYAVWVDATGKGFAREQETLFAVSPETARVDVVHDGRMVDGDLRVDFDLRAFAAGDFAIGATLRGANGELIASLTQPISLTVGLHTVPFTFPGRDIRARGIDGPYRLDWVLFDASWAAVPLGRDEGLAIAPAWKASEFGEH